MSRNDDRRRPSLAYSGKRRQQIVEAMWVVDILLTMCADQEIFILPKFQFPQYPRFSDLWHVMIQNFTHRRAGFDHGFRTHAFRKEIPASVLRIRQIDIADVVDNPAVYFLRDAFVKTSIARLHVKYRDFAALRRN